VKISVDYCVQFQHLSGHWCIPESRAVAEKPHYAFVKFYSICIEICRRIAWFSLQ